MAYMRLGDLLVSSSVITEQQLEKALTMQKETKERLGDPTICMELTKKDDPFEKFEVIAMVMVLIWYGLYSACTIGYNVKE